VIIRVGDFKEYGPVVDRLNRDIATAWCPRSRTSCGLPGYRTGIPRSASSPSEAPGTVDDFAVKSDSRLDLLKFVFHQRILSVLS